MATVSVMQDIKEKGNFFAYTLEWRNLFDISVKKACTSVKKIWKVTIQNLFTVAMKHVIMDILDWIVRVTAIALMVTAIP